MDRLSRRFNRLLGRQATGEACFWNDESNFRFQNYTILMLLGLPTMVVALAYHLRQGHLLLCLLVLFSAAGLVGGWRLVRGRHLNFVVYRGNGLVFSGLLLYLVVQGGADGSEILWLFTYPLICHFLLGKTEGLAWNATFFLLLAWLLLAPPVALQVHAYPGPFKLRLLASYVTISIFSFWFEYLVGRYRLGMYREHSLLRDQHRQLQAALDQREAAEREREQVIEELKFALEEVKTLRGLLPICSYCHKIRNDEGFWNHIETYLQQHADVKFTHGICPECVDIHFPGILPSKAPGKSP